MACRRITSRSDSSLYARAPGFADHAVASPSSDAGRHVAARARMTRGANCEWDVMSGSAASNAGGARLGGDFFVSGLGQRVGSAAPRLGSVRRLNRCTQFLAEARDRSRAHTACDAGRWRILQGATKIQVGLRGGNQRRLSTDPRSKRQAARHGGDRVNTYGVFGDRAHSVRRILRPGSFPLCPRCCFCPPAGLSNFAV